jgi:hypothetical protein
VALDEDWPLVWPRMAIGVDGGRYPVISGLTRGSGFWRWLASSGLEAVQVVAANSGHELMLDCGWRPKAKGH